MSKCILGFLFFIVFTMQPALAQKTKKPQLLVYGSEMVAFATALQGAKSSVPTVWVTESEQLLPELTTDRVSIENLLHLDGGIWMELVMEIGLSKIRNDSLATVIKQDINPQLAKNALDRILSRYNNLTIIKAQTVQSIKRNKKDWQVVLGNKQRFQVRSIVDASKDQSLMAFAGNENLVAKPGKILPIGEWSLEQSRTLLASGQSGDAVYGVSLSPLLFLEKDNFFHLLGVQQLLGEDVNTMPLKANIGQALGATAGYVTFFKTSTDKIDVRKLQTELLTYGARIVPYQDVLIDDPHLNAMQRIGLSGVLKGHVEGNLFYLEKERQVTFEEVEPIFNQLYSRSQLWFADNKGDFFTWKSFLSLIKFVGLKGDEIEKQIEREWSTKLKFEGQFDQEAFVNRYQFATILDRYASPYVKAVNQEGVFVR